MHCRPGLTHLQVTPCFSHFYYTQVHRATLWSGEDVVVKVQRPGLKQLFDIDLQNLKILAEQLDKQDENKWVVTTEEREPL